MALLPQLGSKDTQAPLLSGQQRCLQGKAGALGASSWAQTVGGIRGQRNPLKLRLPRQSAERSSPMPGGKGAVGPRKSGQALVTTDGSARRKKRSITLLREQQHPFQRMPPEESGPLLGTARCPSSRRRPLTGLPLATPLVPVPHELHAVWSEAPLAVSHERFAVFTILSGTRERGGLWRPPWWGR